MTYPQPPGDPNQPPAYPPQYPPTYPPADPNQQAGYPSQPPAYPGQPPVYPGQPPAYPGQPPAYPGQPPAYPGQPPAYPPGYASPSMPMYQQPPQPYPYGMQPAAGGAMNFAMLTQPQQRGFMIVGIGAVLVLIAFFLPLYSVSTASLFGSPASSEVVSAAGSGFLAWLVLLCSLAAGGLAVWRGVTSQPSGLTRRGASITAIVLGSVAVLLMVLLVFAGQALNGSFFGLVSVSVTFGGWILLIATVGILVGGIMQINTKP